MRVRAHRRMHSLGGIGLAVVLLIALLGIVSSAGVGAGAASSGPRVLYVGRLGGITTPKSSTFKTIQAAVDAAKPSDWILIAPGDYHETGDMGSNAPAPQTSPTAGTAASMSPHHASTCAA